MVRHTTALKAIWDGALVGWVPGLCVGDECVTAAVPDGGLQVMSAYALHTVAMVAGS